MTIKPTIISTTYRDCDTAELLAQIGRMNVLAISGGRVEHLSDGVVLPVGKGYSVRVALDWDDTYIVQRIFTRSGVSKIKAEASNVYCDQVGEMAYQASCYHHDFPF